MSAGYTSYDREDFRKRFARAPGAAHQRKFDGLQTLRRTRARDDAGAGSPAFPHSLDAQHTDRSWRQAG